MNLVPTTPSHWAVIRMSVRLPPRHLLPFHLAASPPAPCPIVCVITRLRPTHLLLHKLNIAAAMRRCYAKPSGSTPLLPPAPPPSMRCRHARRNDPPSDRDRTTCPSPLLMRDSQTDSRGECSTSPALRDFDFAWATSEHSEPSLRPDHIDF